jgi:hypothetical protein
MVCIVTKDLYCVCYRTVRHVEGAAILPVPHIEALHQEGVTTQSLARDPHLTRQLEEVVMTWQRHLSASTDSFLAQV